jgi:hypothetical protein
MRSDNGDHQTNFHWFPWRVKRTDSLLSPTIRRSHPLVQHDRLDACNVLDGHCSEVRRSSPSMDNARRAQNGKKNDVNQTAPIPRKRNTGEKRRDQSDRNEGQESKNLVTGIEFFELGEFEHVAQAIGVQVEQGHGEINRREAHPVNDKQRGEL